MFWISTLHHLVVGLVLVNRCPSVLGETNVYATSNKRSYNLSVAIGSRIATVFSAQLFYIHCSVRVCHLDDSASLCSKTCGSGKFTHCTFTCTPAIHCIIVIAVSAGCERG